MLQEEKKNAPNKVEVPKKDSCLQLFDLDPKKWTVKVSGLQPLGGGVRRLVWNRPGSRSLQNHKGRVHRRQERRRHFSGYRVEKVRIWCCPIHDIGAMVIAHAVRSSKKIVELNLGIWRGMSRVLLDHEGRDDNTGNCTQRSQKLRKSHTRYAALIIMHRLYLFILNGVACNCEWFNGIARNFLY